MTTEEFIKKVNALSEDERGGVKATLSITGEPTIETSFTPMHEMNPRLLAYLPRYTKSWKFLEDSTIPGCVLKLMAKLANSKYLEKRYVILNGRPDKDDGFTCFEIRDHKYLFNQLYISSKNLYRYSYTKSELDNAKTGMPWTMKEAIDALTVPLEEAEKMGEDNDN